MARNDKLYGRLDLLTRDFHLGLIRELENVLRDEKFASLYLNRKRREEKTLGRRKYYVSRQRFSTEEDENGLLEIEKQIVQLCEKLGEPLPLPVVLMESYAEAFNKFFAENHSDEATGLATMPSARFRRLNAATLQALVAACPEQA